MAEHKNLAEALCSVQGELSNVELDGQGNYGKYATLPGLINAVRPHLAEHGLSWSTLPSIGEQGQPTMRYQLLHASGELLAGEMNLCMTKQDAQAQGSGLTYARRYALQGVLNIGAEDDDGQTATDAQRRPQAQPAAQSNPTLDDSSVGEVLQSISRTRPTTEELRGQLIAMGLSSVPAGQITRGTIQSLTPEQAVELVAWLDSRVLS